MKEVTFIRPPQGYKHKCRHGKHEMHEKREGVYGEYEEDVREHERKHPANPHVKRVSLWTIHGKGK